MKKQRIVFALLVAVLFVSRPVWTHARAAALLLRFSEEGAPRGLARLGMHEVKEEDARVDLARGFARARYYVPQGVRDPPAIVVAHGVHHLGIDEPRMMKFARAIASTGVLVLTPELKELADYRVEPSSIATIGHAALALRMRASRSEVGVLGLSFAGGLALLAAADAQYARAISFVVAVGAHDDVERVARFFITDEIAQPDGSTLRLHAHDYGAVVLVYMYASSFLVEPDVAPGREALRLWLSEKFDDAREAAKKLSPMGQEKMALVFGHREDVLRPEFERAINAHAADMKRVSPHDALAGLRARVFLLHGEGDSLIPPSETRWLVRDAPKGSVVEMVVSRAIVHVDLEGTPTWDERYELVHLLAGVIEAAEAEGTASPK